MKEIILQRMQQSFSMLNYKIIVENENKILLRNGETKKIKIDKIPTKVYAKQGWVRSNEVIIDNSTSVLTFKNEKNKHIIAPGIGGLILITQFPRIIWEETLLAIIFSISGILIISAWIIYAFIIKRKEWILVEKKDLRQESTRHNNSYTQKGVWWVRFFQRF